MSVHTEYLGDGAGAGVLEGRYELRMEIGRGASGVVWESFDRTTSEIVAVKVLHQHLLSSPRAHQRFIREARSASILDHPHSVAVRTHGCGPNGEAYLVMERLFGVTLASLVQGHRPLPQLRAIRIVAQVLEAAAAAHRMNILHRDLKPNNVMLIDRDGDSDFVKVCDFGLAKEFDTGAISSQLTGHGEVCGTPAYMAPEQARGEQLDSRADIYSVAVMLFQTVVGRLPFQASSPFALASLHLSAPPPRPSAVRPDIAFFPPLESLILRALSKDKTERPSSAEVFRADLLQIERDYRSSDWEHAVGREADTLRSADDTRPRRAKARLLGIAAVMVVLAASVFGALTRAPRRRPDPSTSTIAVTAPPVVAASPPTPVSMGEPSFPPHESVLRRHRIAARPRAKVAFVPQANLADAEQQLRAAEDRLTAGHVVEACALGQVAAARAPQDPAPWEFLGRCLMRVPDPHQARVYYRKYLAIAPEGPKASFIRAIVEHEAP